MKILVVIANYGVKNDGYLSRLLSEYRSMPYQIDIVVLSNVPKNVGPDVELVVGLPTKNPRSLPFGHKRVFAERKDAYDLFVYTEDDILITQRNIDAFMRVTNLLPSQEVAGLFRWEQYPNRSRFYPDVHAFYHWVPDSVKVVGGHTFARFTNDHSGCYLLTRSQLARAIASGGFLVPPHQHHYGLLETAATDPFTQCGLKKLICLSHFEEFLVPHLPNRYLGSWLGLDESEFVTQVEALLHPGHGGHVTASLLNPETKVFHAEWSKDYYEPCRQDLIALFPDSTRSVLSIGCGWGKTEGEFVRKGIDVTAIPLDPVIASCAESRGVRVVHGDLDSAIAQLYGQRFDGVLISGVLHLLPSPMKVLQQANLLLNDQGLLVATIPNFHRFPAVWQRLRNPSRYRGWREFDHSGIYALTRREAKTWFGDAGFAVAKVSERIPDRWKILVTASGGWAGPSFSSEFSIMGRKIRSIAEASTPSDVVRHSGHNAEMSLIGDRRPSL